MDVVQIGLVLNFIGAVLVGISSQFGVVAGFGGPIVWKQWGWQLANIFGWLFLAVGFLLQLLSTRIS